jgi:uncharacterized membrane protein YbhN (UPF0104 family)
MIETILGGLLGGVARLAPEVLKFLDRKAERLHELALGEQQFRLAQAAQQTALQTADIGLMQSQFVAALDAMKEGIKAQGTQTGVRWIDAVSATVRPVVTYWIFALYSIAKSAQIKLAMAGGVGLAEAVKASWGASDDAMLSAVLTFWFIGRVWEREGTRSFR